MRSNAKSFAVVAAGILALCAAMAPAALAVPEFTGIETKDGTHTHVHTTVKAELEATAQFAPATGVGTISCSVQDHEGTLPTGKSTHLTMERKAAATCVDALGRKVDATSNGCTFTMEIIKKIKVDEYEGSTKIVNCPAGKKLEYLVTSAGSTVCTVTVGEQALLPVTITDKTDVMPTDITVDVKANGVKSTVTGGFFNCGVANGEYSNGTMAESHTLRGYNKAGAQIDLEVSG